MDATQQIIKTLSLMGAKPTAQTDSNGNMIIKVNAPTPTEENNK